MMKANGVAIKYLVLFALVFGVPYVLIWGIKSRPLFTSDNFIINALLSLFIFIGGIILHELIHGFFFAVFAKKGIRSVRFGIMWKYLAPYVHCNEPLKIKHYKIVLLAPLFFVGILPAIAGIFYGSFLLTAFGVILSAGAAGDIMIYQLIKKENPENYVQDHPSEAGYFLFRKN